MKKLIKRKTKAEKTTEKKSIDSILAKVLCCFVFILGIFTLATYQAFVQFQDDAKEKKSITYTLEVKSFSNSEELSGCKTVYAEKVDDVVQYSFDAGVTWQNSNYTTVCENKTLTVYGMNEDEDIIAEGEMDVEDLDENLPKIHLDYETEVTSLDKADLLRGVKGESNDADATGNIVVSYEDFDDKNMLVTYFLEGENGTTSVDRLVTIADDNDELVNATAELKNAVPESKVLELIEDESEEDELANIDRAGTPTAAFTAATYNCLKGETKAARVKIKNPDGKVKFLKYGSDNNAVATVVLHPTRKGECKATECALLQIKCTGSGTAKISATLSNKQVATATAKVSAAGKGFIEFNRSEYTCMAYRSTMVGVKVESDSHVVTLSSLKSSNNNLVGNIRKVKESYAGNDRYYIYSIECKAAGSVTLTATASSGKEATSKATVRSNANGLAYAAPEQIVCTRGTSGIVNIQASSKEANGKLEFDFLKSVVSSDPSVATILSSKSVATNCMGCNTYEYYCLKTGSTTFVATSKAGKTTKVPVRVYADSSVSSKGIITFDKDYTCTAGKSVAGKVTIVSGSSATLKTLKSSNTNVATVSKGSTSGGVTSFKISCKKAGNISIIAESSSGASTRASLVVNKSTTDPGKITLVNPPSTLELGKATTLSVSTTNKGLKSVTSSIPSSCTAKITGSYINNSTNVTTTQVSVKCTSGSSVTFKFTGESGATLSKTFKITGATPTEDYVKFSNSNIACYEGKSVNVVVKTLKGVKSFSSSNTNVMKVAKDPHLAVDCAGCVVLKVSCLKKGTAEITATSNGGKTGKATVKVLSTGTVATGVKFNNTSYKCDMTKGKSFSITVTTSNSTITSLKSSNTAIATVKLGDRKQVTGGYQYSATVTCRMDGSVNLVAVDNKNVKATAKLTVSGAGKVTIPSTISCKAGEIKPFLAKSTGPQSANEIYLITSIASFKSSDPTIAEVRNSTGAQVQCIDCRMLEVVCKKEGNVNISVTNNLGAVAYSKVTVNKKTTPDKVAFVESSYTCDLKKTKTYKTLVNSGSDTIKSVVSSDTNVATVTFARSSKHSSANNNVYDVTVTCKKSGTTKLTATSNLNAKGVMTVKVTNGGGQTVDPIHFDKTSYTCQPGKKIVIDAYSRLEATKVTSSDKSIATVKLIGAYKPVAGKNDQNDQVYEKYTYCGSSSMTYANGSNPVYVSDCATILPVSSVEVSCIKAGSVNVTITNAAGAKGVTKVTVKKAEAKTGMSFNKSSYTCEPGKKISATVELKNPKNSDYIKTITSSNTGIATVAKSGNQYGGGNSQTTSIYQKITISCVKAGSVTLTATSNKGVKGTAKVTVAKASTTSSIKFNESTYKCEKGKKTNGQVVITNGTLKNITSDNILVGYVSVGSKKANGNGQIVSFTITCLKTGETKIHATDSTGKKATATVKSALPVVPVEPGTNKSMYFAVSSVSCNAGKKVYTRIMTTGGETVKSMTSADEKIAKIMVNNEFTYSDKNAHGVIIKCLADGTTKVSATSGSNSTTSIPVKVGVSRDAMMDNDMPMLDQTSDGLNELVDEVTEE